MYTFKNKSIIDTEREMTEKECIALSEAIVNLWTKNQRREENDMLNEETNKGFKMI
jgi:hypothetical protein